jgi:hypothetical protein
MEQQSRPPDDTTPRGRAGQPGPAGDHPAVGFPRGGFPDRGYPPAEDPADAARFTGTELRVPLALRDDTCLEPLDGYAPSFLRGSEHPLTRPDEYVFAAIPGCGVVLSSCLPGTQAWLDAWRSPARCTATVTAERVVFGCRLFRDRPGHPQAGKVLGGQLNFSAITRVGIWIAPGGGDSHLLLHARTRTRQWRLAIGSSDLTTEGSALAEEIAIAVARRHLVVGRPDAHAAAQLWACADGIRLRPPRGHGVTVNLPGEIPMGD